ncbi:MAG TPA: hypothetical protein GX739_06420 [Firmicutes bacterium]|nr:hypothetical protein [Bacillota bacterium]
MDITPTNQVLAVITTDRDRVGGSAPIFYVDSFSELEKVAVYLSRVFMAAVHDLGHGVYIIVKH